MIVSVTPRSRRGGAVLVAAGFMIRSKYSAKCSAAADLAAEFLTPSLVAVARGHAPAIVAAGRICGTTWKSCWRKRLSAQKRRLRLRSLIRVTNARGAEPNQVRAKQFVPRARGADR